MANDEKYSQIVLKKSESAVANMAMKQSIQGKPPYDPEKAQDVTLRLQTSADICRQVFGPKSTVIKLSENLCANEF